MAGACSSAWRIAAWRRSMSPCAVAGDAEIDPGVGPAGCQADGLGEGAGGVGVLAEGGAGLAVGIVRGGESDGCVAGVGGGVQGAGQVAGGAAFGIAVQRRGR